MLLSQTPRSFHVKSKKGKPARGCPGPRCYRNTLQCLVQEDQRRRSTDPKPSVKFLSCLHWMHAFARFTYLVESASKFDGWSSLLNRICESQVDVTDGFRKACALMTNNSITIQRSDGLTHFRLTHSFNQKVQMSCCFHIRAKKDLTKRSVLSSAALTTHLARFLVFGVPATLSECICASISGVAHDQLLYDRLPYSSWSCGAQQALQTPRAKRWAVWPWVRGKYQGFSHISWKHQVVNRSFSTLQR